MSCCSKFSLAMESYSVGLPIGLYIAPYNVEQRVEQHKVYFAQTGLELHDANHGGEDQNQQVSIAAPFKIKAWRKIRVSPFAKMPLFVFHEMLKYITVQECITLLPRISHRFRIISTRRDAWSKLCDHYRIYLDESHQLRLVKSHLLKTEKKRKILKKTPDDLFALAFGYLEIWEIGKLSKVSRQFRRIMESKSTWQMICRSHSMELRTGYKLEEVKRYFWLCGVISFQDDIFYEDSDVDSLETISTPEKFRKSCEKILPFAEQIMKDFPNSKCKDAYFLLKQKVREGEFGWEDED